MQGTPQKRFCSGCRKHVYDLSAMGWEDARRLLDAQESPCVRFFQRADGTVMSEDCPVARERLLRRLKYALGVVTALAVLALSLARGLAFMRPGCPFGGSPANDLPPWAAALRTAPPPAPSSPPDEGWMEKRRAQLGSREREPTVGRIQVIGVIRGSSK